VTAADDGVTDEMLSMEPDLATTGHMNCVDNRCACCPYGYHIDIDFLRYLDSLGRSTDPSDRRAYLQHLRDNKHRLRQSMELYLQQQQHEAAAGAGGVDEADIERRLRDESSRYVQSLTVERQDQLSGRVLDSMDGSLFQGGSRSSTRPSYRTETAVSVSHAPGHEYDSSSSISIHSGPSSPVPYVQPTTELVPTGGRPSFSGWRPGDAQNGAHGGTVSSTVQKTMKSQSMVSGGEVTDEVETFLVDGVVNPGHPGIPADMTLISSATLQTIREQMAASLRRMKELEDENRTLEVYRVPQFEFYEFKKQLSNSRPAFLPTVSIFTHRTQFCILLHCQASQTDISKRNSTKLCQVIGSKSP